VVRDHPHGETVLDRRIVADTADISRPFADGADRRLVAVFLLAAVDEEDAGRLAQDAAGLGGGQRLGGFDMDGFAYRYEGRHAHAGGDDLDVVVDDLPRLRRDAPFFFGEAVIHHVVDRGDDVE